MGLVQRKIEAAGITTITISNIPDLTASVSPPRIAAVGYPVGLPFGRPGDREGQMAVLRAVVEALKEIDTPGGVKHLPFEWTEDPNIQTHPPEPPPIAKHLIKKPWLLPKLLSRKVPE